jgi:single-strand DNA-binding protein
LKAFDKVTRVTVATDRDWTDTEGKKHSRTSYVPLSVFDRSQSKFISEHVGEGDLVYVEAHVEEGSFGEGEERTYVVNVIAEEFTLLRKKGSKDISRGNNTSGA